MSTTELIVTVSATLLTGIITGALSVYAVMRQERMQAAREVKRLQQDAELARRREAATWLESVVAAIEEMAWEFSKNQVPYRAANRFNTLLPQYAPYLEAYLGEAVWNDLRRLQNVASQADDLDFYYGEVDEAYSWNELLDEDFRKTRDERVRDMFRLAGELEGTAANIRVGS